MNGTMVSLANWCKSVQKLLPSVQLRNVSSKFFVQNKLENKCKCILVCWTSAKYQRKNLEENFKKLKAMCRIWNHTIRVHYRSFPVATRWWLPCCVANKFIASLQRKGQVCSKSVTSWRLPRSKFSRNPSHQFPHSKSVTTWHEQKSVNCTCFVVSFSKFHYNDTTDLLPTCYGLVQVLNKLATSPSMGKLQGNVSDGFRA